MLQQHSGRINNWYFQALTIPTPLLNAYSVIADDPSIANQRRHVGWGVKYGRLDWEITSKWGYGDSRDYPIYQVRGFFQGAAKHYLDPANCVTLTQSLEPADTSFLRTREMMYLHAMSINLLEDKSPETKLRLLKLMGVDIEAQEFYGHQFDLDMVVNTTVYRGSDSPYQGMSLERLALSEVSEVPLYSDLSKNKMERLVHIGMMRTLVQAFAINWDGNGTALYGETWCEPIERCDCPKTFVPEYVQFVHTGTAFTPYKGCRHLMDGWLKRHGSTLENIPQL